MKKTAILLLAAATVSVAAYAQPEDHAAHSAQEHAAHEAGEHAAQAAAATIAELELAEAMPGEGIFAARCAACHSNVSGAAATVGPNLYGVYGRAAAASKFGYSHGLKNSGLTWDREQLEAYLAAPGKHVPGTRMVVGLSDEGQRAAIIDYLESLSD